ncbi:MAG: hypothetical protein JXB30_16495 [Anaerolineae bacterium]|nr:hypothetical protein [Anaerolineae bacterium]
MKIKLHKPRHNVWMASMVLFVVGLVASVISIPILSPIAFYLVALAAGLLLLGTWVF